MRWLWKDLPLVYILMLQCSPKVKVLRSLRVSQNLSGLAVPTGLSGLTRPRKSLKSRETFYFTDVFSYFQTNHSIPRALVLQYLIM